MWLGSVLAISEWHLLINFNERLICNILESEQQLGDGVHLISFLTLSKVLTFLLL